ncbi:hypothetical protein LCM4577_19190 [Mesorhizobium sp. LCM 4577]|uniref:Uncharacterized protein n=1 Tax=Mesorhizobium plurifarium TaxID=69974 RepID=A0A090DSI8_MESPL|nr:hypothetical protein LCM4577_19190 [Mesorhizobium sp. LCM 4577]OHV67971.1 hypothetical protein LCM4576_23960 [Mesorhizobium sp. LCM 4576]CDX17127.1 hypothetical protein MPL3356_230061 [Mesorhizobium plurifarium]
MWRKIVNHNPPFVTLTDKLAAEWAASMPRRCAPDAPREPHPGSFNPLILPAKRKNRAAYEPFHCGQH